jgi:hypothetical protein
VHLSHVLLHDGSEQATAKAAKYERIIYYTIICNIIQYQVFYDARNDSTIPRSLHGMAHLLVICTVSHHFPAMRTISHFSARLRAQCIASFLSGII